MKKLIAIILIFALTLAVAGCASERTEPKDTPVRVGTPVRGHANPKGD
ncbi:MAG: YgdI/YgdR family lipoprotein [Oscillospiraceae bacterium]|jgi:nitrous oxide reductase accessory protein NosL|nr:YgdI/YgdR family lipoprotein [Oscillospiraceae bacterium]